MSSLFEQDFDTLTTKSCAKCKINKSEAELLQCTKCKKAFYCSKECQQQDWIFHKTHCSESKITQPFNFKKFEGGAGMNYNSCR